MSATNRGAERIGADFYPTPAWCVRRLLDTGVLPTDFGARCAFWLEPCAGDGAIMRAVTGHTLASPRQPSWEGIELRDVDLGIAYQQHGDYLTTAPLHAPDVIITNPPFALSFPIAQKALRDCPSGHVALLLRLNWLGSGTESGRSEWLRRNPPDVYVLPNRPAFVASLKCKGYPDGHPKRATEAEGGCGWKTTLAITDERPKRCPSCGGERSCSTTDATEYAWFVWTPDRARTSGRLVVLSETPEQERAAA